MPISFSPSADRELRARGSGVTAVLGPTNTGKTHLAIERMLAHSSGVIGLPLRLLAREVYNKVVDRVGTDSVALVTGEEKIKPPNPRFWVCTVEAMPRNLDVAFLAVDEVQLGPISSAAMFSPIACSMPVRVKRLWCLAPRPFGRWWRNCCPARMLSA